METRSIGVTFKVDMLTFVLSTRAVQMQKRRMHLYYDDDFFLGGLQIEIGLLYFRNTNEDPARCPIMQPWTTRVMLTWNYYSCRSFNSRGQEFSLRFNNTLITDRIGFEKIWDCCNQRCTIYGISQRGQNFAVDREKTGRGLLNYMYMCARFIDIVQYFISIILIPWHVPQTW